MAVTQWTLAQVVTTAGTTPVQLGADIPLPEDSVTVIDVEAHEITTAGTLSKTHNVRRVFHNEAGTIYPSTLTIMVPSAEPNGALPGSVLIDDSGTDAEVKVVGPNGVAVRWEIWVQVATTTANEFDATSIADCRSWHRASLGVTPSGGYASAWADQSGAADANRNFSATVGNRPLIVSPNAAFNGRDTLDFDGTDDFMVTGTYSSAYSQPVTIYCVFRQTSTGFLFIFDDLDGGSRVAFLDAGGSPSSPYIFAGSSLLGTGGDMPVNTPTVAALVYNSAAGTSAAYINRYNTAAVSGGAGSNAFDSFTIGQKYDGTARMAGSIAELIVYSGAHDSTTRQEVMEALGSMYGIAVTA